MTRVRVLLVCAPAIWLVPACARNGHGRQRLCSCSFLEQELAGSPGPVSQYSVVSQLTTPIQRPHSFLLRRLLGAAGRRAPWTRPPAHVVTDLRPSFLVQFRTIRPVQLSLSCMDLAGSARCGTDRTGSEGTVLAASSASGHISMAARTGQAGRTVLVQR